MAIGPSGPPPMGPPPGRGPVLPPPGMGGGRGPDLPPMAGPPPGGDIMAAKQRLMQIVAEAEAILTQHPELAQEAVGGGPEAGPPVGVPGGIPQTPVAGNTGPPGGMPGLIA